MAIAAMESKIDPNDEAALRKVRQMRIEGKCIANPWASITGEIN